MIKVRGVKGGGGAARLGAQQRTRKVYSNDVTCAINNICWDACSVFYKKYGDHKPDHFISLRSVSIIELGKEIFNLPLRSVFTCTKQTHNMCNSITIFGAVQLFHSKMLVGLKLLRAPVVPTGHNPCCQM